MRGDKVTTTNIDEWIIDENAIIAPAFEEDNAYRIVYSFPWKRSQLLCTPVPVADEPVKGANSPVSGDNQSDTWSARLMKNLPMGHVSLVFQNT